jgi:hypothetical protein
LVKRALNLADAFRKRMGMDRAVAYTLAARVFMILGSTGTVLLIVRFLTKIQQGYYYTLLSLVNLQLVSELGFSFLILQLAAHEAVHLHFYDNGYVEGDPSRRARLAAILQKTVHWYFLAAIVMAVILLPSGIVFFHRNAPGEGGVWLGPWTAAGIFTTLLFVLNPFCSFLEGCGQVRQVARMRLCQALLAVVAAWSSMIAGKGLYSPAMVALSCAIIAGVFLWRRRALFLGLLQHRVEPDTLCWRSEVWSFQWKIAITWLCSYFTAQVLTPVIFASRGAADAGRLGMSVNIAAYIWTLVFAWMSTKAAPFGQLVAKKSYQALDQLFFRTLWQSLTILVSLVFVGIAAIFAIQNLFPALAARMVSPGAFILLLLTAVSTLIVQCEAVYLRAYKEEPFIWQAMAVAFLTSVGSYLAAPRWGVTGACIVYFVCSGMIAVTSATLIFRNKRHSYQGSLRSAPALPLEVAS